MKKNRDEMVALVAGQAHEDWREQWKAQNGDTPRVKKTKDQVWIDAHGKKTELDIAATAYPDLPSDWQGENKAGAEVVVDAVLSAVESDRELDDTFVEEAAATAHTKWVERNGSWAAEELKKPYAELPEAEQKKDRVFVRRAIAAYQA
jgi:hypothetical protein